MDNKSLIVRAFVNDCLQEACVSFKENKECGEKFVSHSIVNIALLVKGSLTH